MQKTIVLRASIVGVLSVGIVALLVTGSAAWDFILTAAIVQDETQELPSDNKAFFTSSREVSVQLDLLAAVPRRLDDALVTVITPDGDVFDYSPDENGLVTLVNIEPGPHAIVATNERAHGTTLIYFEQAEEDDQQDPLDEDALAVAVPPKPTRMTLINIPDDELRPSIERQREFARSASRSKEDIAQTVATGESFDYRVVLDADGVMRGRILSVLETSGDDEFADMQISIIRNERTIRETIAEADGSFQIAGLTPGIYGAIASGPAGYAAFGFELATNRQITATGGNGEYLVSTNARVNNALGSLPIAPIPNIPGFIDPLFESLGAVRPGLAAPAPPAPSGIAGTGGLGPAGTGATAPGSATGTSGTGGGAPSAAAGGTGLAAGLAAIGATVASGGGSSPQTGFASIGSETADTPMMDMSTGL